MYITTSYHIERIIKHHGLSNYLTLLQSRIMSMFTFDGRFIYEKYFFDIIQIVARSMDIKFHCIIRRSLIHVHGSSPESLNTSWLSSQHPHLRGCLFYSIPRVKNNTANVRLCLASVLFVPSYHHELLKNHPVLGRIERNLTSCVVGRLSREKAQ
jgi:hypothetical protein